MEKLDRNFCLIIVLTFAAFLLFYTAYDKATKSLNFEKLLDILSFKDVGKSLREINKVFALEAIALITFTFLLGPLSKMWPQIFGRYIYLRKNLGITGFLFGLAHSVYSFYEFYKLDLNLAIASPKIGGFISAVIALFIFLIMTLTSSDGAIQRMGYDRWKSVQRTGYIALFLTIVHFYIFEAKPDIGLDVRPYGLIFFYLAIAALILRIIVIFIQKPKIEQKVMKKR